jgi:hypothetical protein
VQTWQYIVGGVTIYTGPRTAFQVGETTYCAHNQECWQEIDVPEPEPPPPDPRQAQLAEAYSQFLALCGVLGFAGKAGFAELETALTVLAGTDPLLSVQLSIKLLALQSKWTYYGGTWDECPEVMP